MGSSWYFDETEISSDDPGHSSPDSLSFNGRLFNYPVGSMSNLAGEDLSRNYKSGALKLLPIYS